MFIEQNVCEAMILAARKAAPLEACGLLAGKDDTITRFYELTNADASEDHFSMIPEEQFQAVRDMRDAGLEMLGIWHSHPSSPPEMSAEDLRLAYTPDTIYVIVSLSSPSSPEIAGFQKKEDKIHRVRLEIISNNEKELWKESDV